MSITARSLVRMLHEQGLGDLPLPLRPNPVWLDANGDRIATTVMWREFQLAGLVELSGRLSAKALTILRILAQSNVAYIVLSVEHDQQHRVVVAARDDRAEVVVARSFGEMVSLWTVPFESLPDILFRALPVATPAPVKAMNIRIDRLSVPSSSLFGDRQITADVYQLARLDRYSLIGHGEIYVAIRDEYGRQRITTNPIRYRDTSGGRLLIFSSTGYLSIASGRQELLITQLHEKYRELVDQNH